MWKSIIVLLILTIFFILTLNYQSSERKCPGSGGPCFDGNGKYQHKGRGHDDEDVETLLDRIDWLAKHGDTSYIYTTSFIVAFLSTLGVFLVLYGYSSYVPNEWEILIVVLTLFLIFFSVTTLFGFHDDRYPYYYIRSNIKRIQCQLGLDSSDPPRPVNNYIPHRTEIRDTLSYF